MAPVKRTATIAQRETRSTRSAAVVKKKATATAKATSSPIQKKTTAVGKRGRKQPEELTTEDELAVEEHVPDTKPRSTAAKSTRSKPAKKPDVQVVLTQQPSVAPKSLAAVPRRRIRVTPLDAPIEESVAEEQTKITRGRAKESTGTKATSKRSRALTEEVPTGDADQLTSAPIEIEVPKTRSSRKTATKITEPSIANTVAPRTRGRPEKQVSEDQSLPTDEITAPVPTTRTGRTRGAASVLTQHVEIQDDKLNVQTGKATGDTRKKVTFEGVSDQNDKENQPLLTSKGKKIAKNSNKPTPDATGLRAKPLRKPVASITSSKGRKATTAMSKIKKGSAEPEKQQEIRLPTALTPKKITQVAKSVSEDEHLSDDEDELNGGKTPVRDFGISPRRPPTSAMGQAISPVKKLDLGQNLRIQLATTGFADGEIKDGILASPARRPPASPFKDALKGSPKRSDGAKLLFPQSSQLQGDVHTSMALNPSNIGSASQNMSTLLQSPKRNGVLDAELFSQSAMKHPTTKSPFKKSLLATPAKRLFSPSKKTDTLKMAKISEFAMDLDNEEHGDKEGCRREDREADDLEADIAITSHFRASISPVRVHKVKSNNGGIDFDQSVLEVGSPFKISGSPIKKASKRKSGVTESSTSPMKTTTTLIPHSDEETISHQANTENGIVDPTVLDKVKDNELDKEKEQALQTENQSPALSGSAYDVYETDIQSDVRLPTIESRLNVGGLRDTDETSEDELANDETPIRTMVQKSGLTGPDNRPRHSTGVLQSASGKGFGFTPLAAQMSDWLVDNAERTPKPRPGHTQRDGSFEFSPLAGQHVDGEVVISRKSTPVQKLNLRKSEEPGSLTASTTQHKKLSSLRKSMAQRRSLGSPLHGVSHIEESPARNAQFEEYMEMRAMEEESESYKEESPNSLNHAGLDFDEIMNLAGQDEASEVDADETVLVDDLEQEDGMVTEHPGDLTTDLVAFTHASDTAMVDFHKLAEEADQLAPAQVEDMSNIGFDPEVVDQREESSTDSDSIHGDENLQPGIDVDSNIQGIETLGDDSEEATHDEENLEVQSPILQPVLSSLDSPSMLVIDQSSSPLNAARRDDEVSNQSITVLLRDTTPAKTTMNLNKPGIFNTVVSKVPLKPEGQISPIKMPRKRARSFGASDTSPKKRLSFGSLKQLATPVNQDVAQSPDRRTRTSVAPSPGGTSTPASSRHNRASLGGMSTATTPGQTTFMIDDFGDSTLDGIEVPEDFDEDTELYYPEGQATPAMSERDDATESAFETPRLIQATTPTTSQRTARRATTPATVKKTPAAAAKKAAARHSLNTKSERTPLKPVSNGVLDGIVVYVDVHTSEGADASGIFIELLTQMGAKCVKDWRWNSRASLASHENGQIAELKTGITHVVYKDGGKRTLEKVREAKGEVWCVGVAWVLDCERENKWIDEADYAVDTTIMPRGGSNRRKSMEPRALILGGDGSLSTGKARRSVSAEMNELMKRELLNTPARGQQSALNPDGNEDIMDDDDEVDEQATPTGFVSYDPRTAMTPGTPYLISQGKKLVQMSAPPKQTGKRLFEDEKEDDNNQENEDLDHTARGNDAAVKDAKKFRMKNLDLKARRRTLGFKPVVGSPLAKI